jgi:hypothetical protein
VYPVDSQRLSFKEEFMRIASLDAMPTAAAIRFGSGAAAGARPVLLASRKGAMPNVFPE